MIIVRLLFMCLLCITCRDKQTINYLCVYHASNLFGNQCITGRWEIFGSIGTRTTYYIPIYNICMCPCVCVVNDSLLRDVYHTYYMIGTFEVEIYFPSPRFAILRYHAMLVIFTIICTTPSYL